METLNNLYLYPYFSPFCLKESDSDFYCWICHKEGHVILCELCPRVFHIRCLNLHEEPQGEWVCPECEVSPARSISSEFPLKIACQNLHSYKYSGYIHI